MDIDLLIIMSVVVVFYAVTITISVISAQKEGKEVMTIPQQFIDSTEAVEPVDAALQFPGVSSVQVNYHDGSSVLITKERA